MSEPTTAIAAPKTPLELLEVAISRGIDPDKLDKLLALQERWEASRAAEAFAEAMTGFQAECPPVRKSRQAKGGPINFEFASFDDVMAVARPLLAKYKIVPSFTTEPAEGNKLKVTCHIRVGIHVESTSLVIAAPPQVGKLENLTWLTAQALSYGKRYTLCAALNIVCTDEDNDAATQFETIQEEHIEQINKLIDQAGNVDLDRFLAWLGVDSLETLPLTRFEVATRELQRKIKANAGAKP